jgi:Regulator of ribonuclease activity B
MVSPLGTSDRAILDELAKRGDQASVPRAVSIWIYGSKIELGCVASRLHETWNNLQLAQDEMRCSILADRVQPVTEEAIFDMINEIELAIDGTDAIFDGWETSVQGVN